MDKHLPSRSPPSIPILHYSLPVHNFRISDVILYIERQLYYFFVKWRKCVSVTGLSVELIPLGGEDFVPPRLL